MCMSNKNKKNNKEENEINAGISIDRFYPSVIRN